MAMAGYNPNMSLLPAGGGTIQAMSGGGSMNSAPMNGGYQFAPPMGYNATASVLPAVGGTIPAFSGGFYNQNMSGGLGAPVAAAAAANAAPAPAPAPVTVAPVTPVTTVTAATGARRPPRASKNTAKLAEVAKLASQEQAKREEKTAERLEQTTPVITTATPTKSPNSKQTDKKDLILFGTPITLENPKVRKGDTITENQKKALTLLGLDGDGLTVKEKFQVIQALYDGQCDTDKPLIFLQKCEPIRKIVQSLALNLLKKLDTTKNFSKADDKATVEYIKTESGEVKVCLTFKPEQLSNLSKVSANTDKKLLVAAAKPDIADKSGVVAAADKSGVVAAAKSDAAAKPAASGKSNVAAAAKPAASGKSNVAITASNSSALGNASADIPTGVSPESDATAADIPTGISSASAASDALPVAVAPGASLTNTAAATAAASVAANANIAAKAAATSASIDSGINPLLARLNNAASKVQQERATVSNQLGKSNLEQAANEAKKLKDSAAGAAVAAAAMAAIESTIEATQIVAKAEAAEKAAEELSKTVDNLQRQQANGKPLTQNQHKQLEKAVIAEANAGAALTSSIAQSANSKYMRQAAEEAAALQAAANNATNAAKIASVAGPAALSVPNAGPAVNVHAANIAVTEPVAVTKPAIIEPVANAAITEPVITEPVITEPVITEPVANTAVTEPVANAVTEPAITEPVTNTAVTEPVAPAAKLNNTTNVVAANTELVQNVIIANLNAIAAAAAVVAINSTKSKNNRNNIQVEQKEEEKEQEEEQEIEQKEEEKEVEQEQSGKNNAIASVSAAAAAAQSVNASINTAINANRAIVPAAAVAEEAVAVEPVAVELVAEEEAEEEAVTEESIDKDSDDETNNYRKIAAAAAASVTRVGNIMNKQSRNNTAPAEVPAELPAEVPAELPVASASNSANNKAANNVLVEANNELLRIVAVAAATIVKQETNKLVKANSNNNGAAAAAAVRNINRAAEAAEIIAKSQREAAEAAALAAAATAEKEATAAKVAEVEKVRAAEAEAEAEKARIVAEEERVRLAAEAAAEEKRVKAAEVAVAIAAAEAAKAVEEQEAAAAAAAEAQATAEAAATAAAQAENTAKKEADRVAAEKLKEAEAAAAAAAEAERLAAEKAAVEAAAKAKQEAANAIAAAAAEAASAAAAAAAKAEQEAADKARANATAAAEATAATEAKRVADEAAAAAEADAATAVEQETAINNASEEVRRNATNPEAALIAARSVQNVITNISKNSQLYKSTNFRNLKLNSMMSRIIEKMKIKNSKSSTIITITPDKRQEYINNLKNVLQILTDLKKEIKNKTIPPEDKTAYEAAYQTQIEFVRGVITELLYEELKTSTKDIDNIIALFNPKKLTNNEVTQILESLRKILDIKIEERKQQIKKGNKKSTEKIAIIERIEYILKELADNTKSKGELDIIPIKYYIIEEFIKKHITPEDAKEIAKESEIAASTEASENASIKVSKQNSKLPEDIDFRTARSIDDIMYYLLSKTTTSISKDSIITLYKIMMRKNKVPELDTLLNEIITDYETNKSVSDKIKEKTQKYIDYMKIYRELQDKPTVPANAPKQSMIQKLPPIGQKTPVVEPEAAPEIIELDEVPEASPKGPVYTPTPQNLQLRSRQANHIARTALQMPIAARTVEEQRKQHEINFEKRMNSAKKASTKIQALARGKAARNKIAELKKKVKTAKEAENEAVRIAKSKAAIENQLANETKKERERLNAMRKKTKVSQPELEKGLKKELEKLKTLTQQTKIARNKANTAKINVERANAAVEAAITGPIANKWARRVSAPMGARPNGMPIRNKTLRGPNNLRVHNISEESSNYPMIAEDRLEGDAILSRRKARLNRKIKEEENAFRSAEEKKEQERLQEISAREKEEATRKQAEKSGRMLSEAVKGQPGFIGDTYDFGRVEVPKSKTFLEALSKTQSSKPSSIAEPSSANVDRLFTNVTSTLSTPYREPPKTNKEIKNIIEKTIKKRINESKSLQDKLGWINTYRGTYSKNKEIILFLNKLEDNLRIPGRLNQLLELTQDIPSVTNKEALQQYERRAIIAKTLQERHNRIGAEATGKGKKRSLGGGKQTSKRHPIRRTFRKKDKQSKKKNVSRKKQHK